MKEGLPGVRLSVSSRREHEEVGSSVAHLSRRRLDVCLVNDAGESLLRLLLGGAAAGERPIRLRLNHIRDRRLRRWIARDAADALCRATCTRSSASLGPCARQKSRTMRGGGGARSWWSGRRGVSRRRLRARRPGVAECARRWRARESFAHGGVDGGGPDVGVAGELADRAAMGGPRRPDGCRRCGSARSVSGGPRAARRQSRGGRRSARHPGW